MIHGVLINLIYQVIHARKLKYHIVLHRRTQLVIINLKY